MRGVQRIDRQRDSSRDGKIRCKEENKCEVEHVKVKYEQERDKDLQRKRMREQKNGFKYCCCQENQ